MEDFKHLCNSRKGYRLHLKKLLAKANDFIERHYNKDRDLDAASFIDLRDQLQWKDTIISDLNNQIFKLIADEEELVDDICKAEEIKESLTTTITHFTQILDVINKSVPINTQPSPPLDKTIGSGNPESTIPGTQTTEADTQHIPLSDEPNQETQEHSPVPQPNPVSGTQNVTQLPKLSMPVFSGNALQWQSFWDCFEAAVHHNPSITGVQKLNYLRAQLQEMP